MASEIWPGMTRLEKGPTDDYHVYKKITEIPNLLDRKIILLATATITDDNIFANGLYQNVFFLLKTFDAMGYMPILIVNDKPKSLEKIPSILRSCRVICAEDLIKQPIPVSAYIEIGMSIDHIMRKYLKMIGSKTCKLYLGNILNIDIETPIFYPGMNFAHHVVGEIQEIWTSAHYGQNVSYACALNNVEPDNDKIKVAPYVWDYAILTDGGKRSIGWKPREPGEKEVFVIMEPNISFQKSSIIPLMILEAWYRKHPDWKGEIVVINGERLMQVPFFKENVYRHLSIVQNNLVKMVARMDIVTTLNQYPSATFLCHQINNEFNYMLLELLWCSFPVLHNSTAWNEFGYYYKGSDIEQGAQLLEQIRTKHAERIETYKSHARTLAWRHSPYNPDIHRAWKQLLNID